MDLSSFLFGSEDKFKKLPTMNNQQNQFFNQFMQMLMGGGGMGGGMQGGFGQATNLLQQYLNPESDIYQNFEAPYRQQFENETVPMLAERFAGMGGGMGGALGSSGFGQALGAAGANLNTNLAQLKSGMQRQSISDLLNQFNMMSQLGLGTQSFAYGHQPASLGLFPSMAMSFAKGAGQGMAGGV